MPKPITIPLPKRTGKGGVLECDVCHMRLTADGPAEAAFMWAPRVEGTKPTRPPVHGPHWHLCVVCEGCASVMRESKSSIYDLLRQRAGPSN